ncbi:MAG: hypothetical protein AVDCRST_MAG19-1573 [uncultured Thermomicrobiales bacterium]|uniref:Uncharacterized protein n=1 Tax=uncultured Thermomicrobiales bacterium TaxID=1645740 RepID=A0A6J4U8F1_9BACT|nr:MAG: hypothetical protein AVDCRST_MAG19-1573 [uncultured Thermomicrobiales bacterium]
MMPRAVYNRREGRRAAAPNGRMVNASRCSVSERLAPQRERLA